METNVDHVVVYRDEGGEWRWRAVAGNGEIVGDSGEGYTREVDAARAVAEVFSGEMTILRISDVKVQTPDETAEAEATDASA